MAYVKTVCWLAEENNTYLKENNIDFRIMEINLFTDIYLPIYIYRYLFTDIYLPISITLLAARYNLITVLSNIRAQRASLLHQKV
jgi:hypothetical protein